MHLSVMMAAYNARDFIQPALLSVLRQDLPAGLEIIVIDDGSTDDTAALVARMAQDWPQIRMIRTQNQGVTRARNAALQALRPDTQLVSFLDADDLVPAGRFARDLALFRQDPELELIYGVSRLFRTANHEQTAPAAGSETALGRGVVLAAGTYRAETLRAVGLFDESLVQAEDMDFFLRLLERGPKYKVLEEVSLYYRRHPGNMTLRRDELQRGFSRALMLSARRRRQGNLAPYPSDFFDAGTLVQAKDW